MALVAQNSDGNALCMMSSGESISFFVILEPVKTHEQRLKHAIAY